MEHIKLFENFLNEGDAPAPGALKLAEDTAKIIFGHWTKGEYSSDNSYAYGQEYEFQDGTKEKGYVVNSVTLKLNGPNIALKFVEPKAMAELQVLTGKDFDFTHLYSCQWVGIRVRTYSMISSEKTETTITAILGPTTGTSTTFHLSTREQQVGKKSARELAAELTKILKDGSKQVDGVKLVRQVFDDLAYSYLPRTKDEDKSNSRHQGIGSQASTHVEHDIKRGYDVREYVKKFGKERLLKAIEGTYFKKKNFEGLEDGVLLTDESWVDVYD